MATAHLVLIIGCLLPLCAQPENPLHSQHGPPLGHPLPEPFTGVWLIEIRCGSIYTESLMEPPIRLAEHPFTALEGCITNPASVLVHDFATGRERRFTYPQLQAMLRRSIGAEIGPEELRPKWRRGARRVARLAVLQ